MKKYLNTILTAGSAFLALIVYLLGLAPAAKVTVFGATAKSSFYDLVGNRGACTAALILLTIGVLCAIVAAVLPFVKLNGMIVSIASAAACLFLLITGILFFCAAPDGAKLAGGAVFCALFSLIAAGASGANAFLTFKNK